MSEVLWSTWSSELAELPCVRAIVLGAMALMVKAWWHVQYSREAAAWKKVTN